MASSSSGSITEYNFINELEDDYKCSICFGVARDPHQHQACGKLFCKMCLDKVGRDKPCSFCRMQHSHFYEDTRGRRAIMAIGVKCHNVKRRCEWEGTVGTIEQHMATCQFTLLPCPNQCKSQVMKKDLNTHLKDCPNRGYKCQHCGEKGKFAHINEIHEKLITCPNDECNAFLVRCRVDQHVKFVCIYTKLPCKYERIGCSRQITRRDLVAHEQDCQAHLCMAMAAIVQLKNDHEALKNSYAEMRYDNEQLKKVVSDLHSSIQLAFQPQAYILANCRSKMQDFTFPAYYTHPRGYHVALLVYANQEIAGQGMHVSVYIKIVRGEFDTELKWPLLGNVTFTLLNQFEDNNHHTQILPLTTNENITAGKSFGYSQFIPHSALGHDPIKNTQYLKDDTLYFRMSVEVAQS